MTPDALALSVHLGEGDRDGGGRRPLADALMDLLAAREPLAAVLLRGVEGFGIRHRRRTDRLLSLSEDLPLVATAVDRAERIAPLAAEAAALVGGGLVTLERLTLPDHSLAGGLPPPRTEDDEIALTAYCGRGERSGGGPVAWAALMAMRAAGMTATTILAGLDGVVLGDRRRARFMSRNVGVPAVVRAVGPRAAAARALIAVRGALPGRHLLTAERVRVVRRGGRAVADLPAPPAADAAGNGVFQRVTVVAAERRGGRPLHGALLRGLREHGAAGATVLRGVGGHVGDGPLHADRLLAVRRRAIVVLTFVDTVPEVARLWPVVARATASTGLVTCESVPAARAVGPGGPRGGLALADVRTGAQTAW